MRFIDKKLIKELVRVRRYFHRFPELSGEEANTSVHIEEYLNQLHPLKILTGIGGFGVAAVFKGERKGRSVMLRCDMDALPINESNDFLHKSKINNISHKCGHDGHIAILLGVASLLSKYKIQEGEVILLFQPAEETGAGALKVIQDPAYKELIPDLAFALHNIPGYPVNSVIVKDDCFNAASAGMEVQFFGKTSHAAEPETGNNPALAVALIIRELYKLNRSYGNGTFLTIIHVDIGEISYGTLPGKAVMRCTLRSDENEMMRKLAAEAENIVTNISLDHNLTNEIRIVEEFPALMNDKDCVQTVMEAAVNSGMEVIGMEKPLPWSEDFSQFLLNIPGCLFGLGAGKNLPKLHSPDYDFPDRLIEGGIKVFINIINNINGVGSLDREKK